MKICQTLWCAHKDLMRDSFGWYSPMHHLIAWAYSSLKLKELYPDVELFTDSQGTKILIDTLNLPYTKSHAVYDDLRCNPALWAFPKILTYSRQNEPFIHVDGDVFVWEKFNENLEGSRLIAQNLEISTDYYANLFRPIRKNITYVPDIFKENLFEEFPKSYNAGILGGRDIQAIQRYTDEAVKFVDANYLCHSNGNFNMMFEQLLFYSVAQKQNITPACFYEKVYNDNGYAIKEVGDFFPPGNLKYIHLIGRLKRDKFICDQLVRRLCIEYPDYFDRISALFKSSFSMGNCTFDNAKFAYKQKFIYPKTRMLIHNLYQNRNIGNNEDLALFVGETKNRVLRSVYGYEKKVHRLLTRKFTGIGMEEILRMEEKINDSAALFNGLSDNNKGTKIYLNPYLEVLETPFDVIDFNPYEILRAGKTDKKRVAVVPQLFAEGYKEINLDPLSANILTAIYTHPRGITLHILKDELSTMLKGMSEKDVSVLITDKLKYLTGTNLIFLDKAQATNKSVAPVSRKRHTTHGRVNKLNSQTILN